MALKSDTEADAPALLEKIKTYWKARGYDVTGYVKPVGFSPRLRSTVYEIETDMVNGAPRKI
ncbi:MAG: phosphoglycolate phosphatase [Pseudomonadota bacterium]